MTTRFLSQIKGLQVVGSKGMVLGNVEDLEFSEEKLSGLVIAVRNSHVAELGLRKPLWGRAHVVVPAEFVASIADVAVLSVSLKEFGEKLAAAKPPEEAGVPKEELTDYFPLAVWPIN